MPNQIMEILLRDVDTSGGMEDMAKALVERLGLVRKKSNARHDRLLMEFMKMKKKGIPLSIEEISRILGVSLPQAYHELRKWKALGLVESVKLPAGDSYIKGYMLSAATLNRAVDKVEYRLKAFIKKTRRIAKEMDDLMAVENLRERDAGSRSNPDQLSNAQQ